MDDPAPVHGPPPITSVQQRDGSAELMTRSSYAFSVRPAEPCDEAALAEFFAHVGQDDLRFRFLAAVQKVGAAQLKALVTVDHHRTENLLAIDPPSGLIVATAMTAADGRMERAEIAIAIRSGFKGLGIGWTLLDHVAEIAAGKGLRTLESIESRDNHDAIRLEREQGWTASPVPGDASLVTLRKHLAAGLNAPEPAFAAEA